MISCEKPKDAACNLAILTCTKAIRWGQARLKSLFGTFIEFLISVSSKYFRGYIYYAFVMDLHTDCTTFPAIGFQLTF